MEHYREIKVPKDRIGVIVGHKGKIKKKLEELANIEVNIDSEEGIVTISGEDAITLMEAKDVIKAIARGFNPQKAFNLIKPECYFELIDLKLVSKGKKDAQRIKGRIIGSDGKCRHTLEDLTNTYISVYGKTVGIIGDVFWLNICKKAIKKIIEGMPHSRVYKWLENQRKKSKQESVEDAISEGESKD